MQFDLHRERAMTPDIHASSSAELPNTAGLLRALAGASDWDALCAALARDVPAMLPSTRLDIYALGADNRAMLRFTTAAERAVPAPAETEVQLRYQLQREGYGAIMIVPLVAAGRAAGWLALARLQGRIAPRAQALGEQIAPLIALWLCYERRDADLAAGAEREEMLERRLRDADALRLRATLMAGAAHDIGNLFTTMMGYAQILQQDLPAAFQGDLRMIIRALEDGRQLLRRLQSGDPLPTPSPSAATSVAQILDEVTLLTRPLWERRQGISVATMPEDAPAVRMPAEDLREVLVNLMINAVAAIREDGVITLRCRAVAGYAVISVADTGHGIARERHSSIFQPFVTSRSDGSGLGLSVSRALVEGYGGTLSVDSEPGRGATFTISLPIAS
jgi:signal transduction histidine kinase